jgi:hypothetical protein
MKKNIFGVIPAVCTALLVTGIYFGCTKDDEKLFFDLTGRWSGVVYRDSIPPSHVELDLVQDTTGNVTGFVYTYDEKSDTVPILGTISDDQFTGIFNGHCVADLELKVSNDGFKLVGTAVDRPATDCGGSVKVLLFKVLAATEDISGNWNGTRKSSVINDEETFALNFAQTGNNVTGVVISPGDTTSLNGRMIGSVFEGMVGDQSCEIFVYIEISGSSGKGVYVGGGEEDMACSDHGTVTVSRPASKRIRK